MEQKLSRYQNLIVLLITLLLHAGIILSIILIKFDNPQTEAMVLLAQDDEPEQYPKPQNDWVTVSQASAAAPSQPIPSPSTPQNTPEAQSLEQQPSEEKTTPALNEEQIQSAVSIAQKLLARAEKSVSPAVAPHGSYGGQAPSATSDKPEKKEPNEVQPTTQTPPQSPTLTLAQLTQGFMQHLQESPMTVRSNNDGQASMEQMKQMHYMQKVIACIVNSYKINNNSSLRGYSMQQARVQLAINRDGTIHTLQLVQSSGNMTIDQFLLTMFQDASSSFPPLPSSFKENTFHVPVFNVDRLESFQSTNGWYIDNTMP